MNLDIISGLEFETLIALLLDHMGFCTEMTRTSGDGGVDIIATLDQPLIGGRYLVQCKRYAQSSLVGAATVREFFGAVTADPRATKGILITTSGFTSQAREFAVGTPIELIGREDLLRLLVQYGLAPDALGASSASEGPVASASNLVELAGKLREHDQYDQAIKLLRQAIKLQPDSARAWLDLGVCYGFVKLHDEQVEALRKSVKLDPESSMGWYWLGFGLEAIGDIEDAEDALKRARQINPGDVYATIEISKVLWKKGERDSALTTAEEAVRLKPDDVSPWFNLGCLCHDSGLLSEAASAFREALRIDPSHTPSWQVLCWVYKWAGDRTRMMQALSRLEELDPPKAHGMRSALLQ